MRKVGIMSMQRIANDGYFLQAYGTKVASRLKNLIAKLKYVKDAISIRLLSD